MPAWLLPAVSALAPIFSAGIGAVGQNEANKANQRAAREQMRFQDAQARQAEQFSERMSSTAIQRRVADLKAAGLNPGLAYEGTASSPTGFTMGGAAGSNENALANVVSTALQAKQIKQAMQFAKEQNEADLGVKHNQQALLNAQRHNTQAQTNLTQLLQPHTVRRQQLENLFLDMEIPGRRNAMELEKRLEGMGGSTTMRLFLDFVKGISGIGPRR